MVFTLKTGLFFNEIKLLKNYIKKKILKLKEEKMNVRCDLNYYVCLCKFSIIK